MLEAFRDGLATKADVKESENALRADMQRMESMRKGEFKSLLRWVIALVVGLFAAWSAFFLQMMHERWFPDTVDFFLLLRVSLSRPFESALREESLQKTRKSPSG